MPNWANKSIALLFIFFLLTVSFTTAAGRIIYVDGDAVAEFDGSSWTWAYLTLQDAISDAWYGDEIRVAHGTYRPDQKTLTTESTGNTIMASGDREDTFELIYNVTFKGGYAGYGEPDPDARDFVKYETILSGDLGANDVEVNNPRDLLHEPTRAENSYNVVAVSGTAILDGFTITGGNAVDNGALRTTIDLQDSGGGLLNRYGIPRIINCTITGNAAGDNGGGMYNDLANPTLVNCTFTGNYAGRSGGAMGNNRSTPNLINCTFSNNSASQGGGAMHNDDSDSNMLNCKFIDNTSRFGGAIFNYRSNLVLEGCAFIANYVSEFGGAIYSGPDIFHYSASTVEGRSQLRLRNCIFIANRAEMFGAGMSSNSSDISLTNCTFAGNSAQEGNALGLNGGYSNVDLRNCIIWDGAIPMWIRNDSEINIIDSEINVIYSNISGGWPGEGNIDSDPRFADTDGLDNIPGTEDDDLRLTVMSPCVNTGNPDYVPESGETDIDGNRRIVGGRIDMGAHEFQWEIYVDDDAVGDLGPNDPSISDPLEDGTKAHPFDTIQEAIDVANNGHIVLVMAGLYPGIDYRGKSITVAGADGAAVIEASLLGRQGDGVTFHTGEGPDSVLRNLTIRNSTMAISLNYGSTPTISNLTIVDNDFGIAAYENSNPDIRNCIFWNNRDGDLYLCGASYSCIQSGVPGEGNISIDPLFVDAANGDYHLVSQGLYWNTFGNSWTWHSYLTSPCIDAGDPSWPLRDEPMRVPNIISEWHGVNQRINMGAFGGTSQASIPPIGWMVPENVMVPTESDPAQWAPNDSTHEVYDENGLLVSNGVG